jgi:hypothetical protein
MFLVIGLLNLSAAVNLFYGILHRLGDGVGIHYDMSIYVSDSTPHGLHVRFLRPEVAFFISIEDGY